MFPVLIDITQLEFYPGTSLPDTLWAIQEISTGKVWKIKGSQIAGSGGPWTSYRYMVPANGTFLSIAALAGKTVQMIFRGTPVEVITGGTPMGEQVKADNTTDPTALQLTSSATNPFTENEQIFITYN